MRFTKMHGLGNDYIYLNCLDGLPEDVEGLARRLSDRHFGVGGDGLICLCASQNGDFGMRMYNADGSEGRMCGNGIRCLAKFAYDKGLTQATQLTIDTASGPRQVHLHLTDGQVTGATVDMGRPAVGKPRMVLAGGREVTGIPVDMGNPHFVVPAEHSGGVGLSVLGPALGRLPCFPDGINVEVVRARSRASLEVRVWERGSGETLACGTGACACLAALAALDRADRRAEVRLPGGRLQLEWSLVDGHMYMTGPTTTVFDGEIAD